MSMLLHVVKVSDLKYQVVDMDYELEALPIEIKQEELEGLDLRVIVMKFLRNYITPYNGKTPMHFIGEWDCSDSYYVMVDGESV